MLAYLAALSSSNLASAAAGAGILYYAVWRLVSLVGSMSVSV